MKYKKNYFLKEIKKNEYLKWSLVILIFILIPIENYLFQRFNTIIKLLLTSIIISINLVLIYYTKHGKKFLSFIRESKTELHKIKWPSKQEALHTTLIILLCTIIISLILWGLDKILFRFISFLITIRL